MLRPGCLLVAPALSHLARCPAAARFDRCDPSLAFFTKLDPAANCIGFVRKLYSRTCLRTVNHLLQLMQAATRRPCIDACWLNRKTDASFRRTALPSTCQSPADPSAAPAISGTVIASGAIHNVSLTRLRTQDEITVVRQKAVQLRGSYTPPGG